MKPVCDTCNLQCKNITHYVNHCRTHRHIRNARFTCRITGCIRTFYTYKALVSHIARNHTAASYDQGDGHDEGLGSYRNVGVGVKCMLEFCQHQSSDIKELISHLRGHIESGLKVNCPFENCKIQFGNKKSFSSHLSRHHRNYKVGDVASRYVVTVSQGPTDVVGEAIFPIGLHNEDNSDRNELDEQDSVETEQEQDLKSRTSTSSSHEGDTVVCGENPSENVKEFTQSVALFLLKLQSKYLIPNSTIQVIVEQMCFLNQLGNENTKKCIVTQLQTAGIGLGLADERCNELAQDIMTDVSELGCSLAPASDSQHFQSPECGKLRSGYMRKKYWKENFKYESPESIYLGELNGGKKEYCHYVPILETLKLMYEDKSVQNHIIPVDKERSGYSDIQDGKVFRQNTFYQRNPDALQVMLFQDGFEVVNPLGSSRNKHKMLGVYCTLGNIDARCRSQIDPIQLVLLCKEKTLKKIDSQRVFSRLITDLKHLEENGIVLKNGYVVKGTVVAIIGDNLGSHYIGGFCESFSSHYYCRYCLLSKIEIAQGLPYLEGVYRTRESYRRALQSLDDDGESVHHEGIKFDSLFNSLTYFHVASPGLPPCLGHDLFEGVVDYDMALFIQYFVAKKWFSYEELNRRLQLFPFKGRDSADMLTSAVKPQGERIGGQAVQNWLDSSSTASDTDTDRDTVIISDIERVCWNSVPDINDEQLRRLLAKLEAAGVLTTDDLEYIREDDILGIVTPIQARKLIKGFKKDESSSNADSSPSSSGQSRTASRWQPKEVTLSLSPVEGSKSAPSKVIDLDMMLNRIPRKTIHILERNERLPPRIRKEFVRLVVDNIIDCKGATYPRTSELRLYASQIVSKYKTLGDHLDGVVVGTGYESLLKQFVNRVDNLGRSVVQGSLKRKALAGCKSPKERLADQYGCVNWQPESLPEGESGESQRKIMNELKSLWESGTGKTKDVKNKMIHTYATQRKDINEKDCVLTDIIENWPFLFEEEYLLAHFKKLMGFDIMEKMSSNFEHRVPKLYRYFQQVAKPKIEATHKKIQDAVDKKEDNSPQVMGLLMLLSEHLGEDLGEHVKSTDKEKSADTCIEAMDLQGPVVLVAHGKVLTATLFSLAIGGKETTKVTNPLSGVCVWFAAYYVFNLQYPEKAPALLEFIQRIFLGINPDCGTKRQKMKGKKSAVNPVVLKLAGEMSNFENDWAL